MNQINTNESTNSNGQTQQSTQSQNQSQAQTQQNQQAAANANAAAVQAATVNLAQQLQFATPTAIHLGQNFIYSTNTTPQTPLYHYQIIKSPSPTQPMLTPNDQTVNFITQATAAAGYQTQATFATKTIDINNNNLTAATLCANPTYTTTQTNNLINLTTEQQIYEYMHQLLEEKEKLKELYNEQYSFSLPISAKLLDEGMNNLNIFNLFFLSIL